jgi:hypothetical protein
MNKRLAVVFIRAIIYLEKPSSIAGAPASTETRGRRGLSYIPPLIKYSARASKKFLEYRLADLSCKNKQLMDRAGTSYMFLAASEV